MNEKKSWAICLGTGFLLGALLVPAAVWLIQSMAVSEESLPVSARMVEAVGSTELAIVIQSLLGGLFGGVAAAAALPFADDGTQLLLRSLLHLTATLASFALLVRGCWWADSLRGTSLFLALLALVYILIWLGRWVSWYMEVVQLRAMLGLKAKPSRLNWAATLAYLPFALLVCLLLPLVLMWIDRRFVVDVPLFSGLVLPYLLLPLAGFFSGLTLGRKQGLCPLYPVLLFVCYLPTVWLVFNSTALFHCFMAAVPAALGNGLGYFLRCRSACHNT